MLKTIAAIAIGASICLAMAPSCGVAKAKNSQPTVKAVAKYNSKLITLMQNSEEGTAKGELLFTNISRGNLVVMSVISDCDCIKATSKTNPVAPGKQGTIPISYTYSYNDQKVHDVNVIFSNSEGAISFLVNKKINYNSASSK